MDARRADLPVGVDRKGLGACRVFMDSGLFIKKRMESDSAVRVLARLATSSLGTGNGLCLIVHVLPWF
jgi:hypothetical protein